MVEEEQGSDAHSSTGDSGDAVSGMLVIGANVGDLGVAVIGVYVVRDIGDAVLGTLVIGDNVGDLGVAVIGVYVFGARLQFAWAPVATTPLGHVQVKSLRDVSAVSGSLQVCPAPHGLLSHSSVEHLAGPSFCVILGSDLHAHT